MVLRIEDDPHAVLEVLWIREAWALDPVGQDLPPLLAAAPQRVAATADPVWVVAWPLVWDAVVEHAAIDVGALIPRITDLPEGAAERAELIARIVGPSWRSMVGTDALPAPFEAWAAARFDRREPPGTLADEPERVCLDAVVPAWRAGLTTVITVPCRGTHTRRIGDHALLVTEGTRADPDAYRRALAVFADPV